MNYERNYLESRHNPRQRHRIFTHDFRLERRLHLAILNLLPVDAPEEQVTADVLLASISAAQALRRILGEEALAHVLGLLAQVLRIGHVVVRDGSEQLLLVLAVKRRLADEHLVQEDAVRPPVDRLAVRLIEDDLRGDVVRGAAERLGRLVQVDVLLAHAKVRYLNVTVGVQQHVVQLQVTINDATRVQEEQSNCDFRGVETERGGGEGRKGNLSSQLSFGKNTSIISYTATGSLNFPHC